MGMLNKMTEEQIEKLAGELDKRRFKHIIGYLEIVITKYNNKEEYYHITVDGVSDEVRYALIGLMEEAKQVVLERGRVEMDRLWKRLPFWKEKRR